MKEKTKFAQFTHGYFEQKPVKFEKFKIKKTQKTVEHKLQIEIVLAKKSKETK